MLESMPRVYGERIFSRQQQPLDHFRDAFAQQRKRIAEKLKNPRLSRITFHSLRHFKGTMEYHRTLSIPHVMSVLGHKSVKNTMMYIQIAQELFKGQQDYVCEVAKNVKEACILVANGFEYITGDYKDGGRIFRKPKYP